MQGSFFIGERPAYNSARDLLLESSGQYAPLRIDQIEWLPYHGLGEQKIES
jgi:hypothetical protein